MNRHTIAKRHLTVGNDLQKFLGGELEKSQASGNIDEELGSIFIHPPLSFASRIGRYDARIEANASDSEEVIKYPIPKSCHELLKIDLCVELPRITVKPEFESSHRVSWTPKTLFRIIDTARMYIDDEQPLGGEINSYVLDFYAEYYGETLWGLSYEEIIENASGTTEWSTLIDSKYVYLPQPFFFTNTRFGLKRKLISNPSLTLNYLFRRNCQELVRIQEFNKEKNDWVLISTEDLFRICDIEGINSERKIRIPELWGVFGVFNDKEEQDWEKDISTSPYFEHTHELVELAILSAEVQKKGTITVEIKEPGCFRGLFYAIINTNSEEDNFDYFDYTNAGKNNCLRTTYISGSDQIWRDLNTFHHSRRTPHLTGLRTPKNPGYNYIPISFTGKLNPDYDNHEDLSLTKHTLKIDFSLKGKGRLVIIADFYRLVEYSNGLLTVHTNLSPTTSG